MQARAQHIGWAQLLKRVFDIYLRRCPSCGAGELNIIAAILQRAAIEKILAHLGLDLRRPPRGRADEAGLLETDGEGFLGELVHGVRAAADRINL